MLKLSLLNRNLFPLFWRAEFLSALCYLIWKTASNVCGDCWILLSLPWRDVKIDLWQCLQVLSSLSLSCFVHTSLSIFFLFPLFFSYILLLQTIVVKVFCYFVLSLKLIIDVEAAVLLTLERGGGGVHCLRSSIWEDGASKMRRLC